ncbi:MAG: energy-coupling factor transporter transmembrane component T [Clostridia bacterium]
MSAYGFRDIHPVIQMIYFLVSLLAIMIFPHPFILSIFVIFLSVYLIKLKGVKKYFGDIKLFIFLSIIVILVNPIFNQRGRNILAKFGNRVITLEAIIYGTVMALMLISIILLFQIFNEIVNSHKFLYVFSKFAPKSAFLANMALRYIPLMRSRFKSLIELRAKRENYKRLKEKIKVWGSVLSILLTWSFEEAIITADSMKSRGYELKKRTNYRIFKWRNKDFLTLLVLGLIFITLLIYKFLGVLEFNIYPKLDPLTITRFNLVAFISIFILSNLPYTLDEGEKLKWRNLE